MKRMIAILLACLLLCGCAAPQVQETTTAETETTAPAVDPTEPGGSYDPESPVEAATGGAVRAYPLSIENIYGAACMGKDLLIFSSHEKTTILTKLSGENLYVTATAQIGFQIYPDEADVQVTDKGISYYDALTHELVTLDSSLKEISRKAMPEDMVGEPILSADRDYLYYCTDNAIREYAMETGISRLLKEQSAAYRHLETLLLDGTVLCCNVSDGEGSFTTQYISTENGQTIWEGESDFLVTGSGENWYGVLSEGIMTGFVFGNAGGDTQMLVPGDFTVKGRFLEDMNWLVTQEDSEDYTTVTLDVYDLSAGLRLSQLELTGYYISIDANPDTGEVFILSDSLETGAPVLYRWNVAALPTGDETVYTTPWYSRENPDAAGLAQCRDYAALLSQMYGVEILIGDEAVTEEPWEYDLTSEYQVPVLKQALTRLEQALAVYPEGMLKAAAASNPDGILRICVVRSLQGSPESGSLETAEGVHFWVEDNQYIAVAVGEGLTGALYHELYHALESRLLSSSSACYDWEYLNPEGFDYDYDYVLNQSREDHQYLEDENRYFIDMYSMSFPKEDRARIMEYAMGADNGHYFQSEAMQAKLLALCKGLREAYDLEKYPEPFLWEQYLTEPLAYTK